MLIVTVSFVFFFFNDTATTEIYTLSLHDALPISFNDRDFKPVAARFRCSAPPTAVARRGGGSGGSGGGGSGSGTGRGRGVGPDVVVKVAVVVLLLVVRLTRPSGHPGCLAWIICIENIPVTLSWRRPSESVSLWRHAFPWGAGPPVRAFSSSRRYALRSRPQSARAGLPEFLRCRQSSAFGRL